MKKTPAHIGRPLKLPKKQLEDLIYLRLKKIREDCGWPPDWGKKEFDAIWCIANARRVTDAQLTADNQRQYDALIDRILSERHGPVKEPFRKVYVAALDAERFNALIEPCALTFAKMSACEPDVVAKLLPKLKRQADKFASTPQLRVILRLSLKRELGRLYSDKDAALASEFGVDEKVIHNARATLRAE
jgi:hypothetical protein